VLVDAKGVSRLYEGRARRRDVLLLIASAVIAMFVVAISSESWGVFIDGFRLWFDNVRDTVRGWF
jgi:uncharacterized membrane-anchored protein